MTEIMFVDSDYSEVYKRARYSRWSLFILFQPEDMSALPSFFQVSSLLLEKLLFLICELLCWILMQENYPLDVHLVLLL